MCSMSSSYYDNFVFLVGPVRKCDIFTDASGKSKVCLYTVDAGCWVACCFMHSKICVPFLPPDLMVK